MSLPVLGPDPSRQSLSMIMILAAWFASKILLFLPEIPNTLALPCGMSQK